MAGIWMTATSRARIESFAASATCPIAMLPTEVHTVQANLRVLAQCRSGSFDGLPYEQTSMPAFKQTIVWHALEDQQARDEAH